MTTIYGIIKDTYSIGKFTRVSWGIAVYVSSQADKTFSKIKSIHNITSDKKKIMKLIRQCNRLQLSTIHLDDVIEDFLIS